MAKLGFKGRISAFFAAAAALNLLVPSLAYAVDENLGGLTDMADTILLFMTGPIATAAGAIAIAFVGYRWFSGRMEIGRAAATVAGIVLVIGSVQIVSFIRKGADLKDGAKISALELNIQTPATPLESARLYRDFV